ncbi:MAG TPA: tetratricopeptide repeat protein [Tepidisphaeraceae bacterium]|jgi:tetratricopeptide (TPR) repeat protein|nr:tetratricopeptide repeat protein [Tepidisphaeraceae bacterium]
MLNRLPLVLLILIAPAVYAGDLASDSAPMKWIEPLMPEDLPELTYPAYFTDLDKAQAQEVAGRYKLSLITLKNLKDLKPDQRTDAALIKGRSQAALGRWEGALATLSSDDPRVQIERAQVLSRMGKDDEALALLKRVVQKQPDSIAGHYWLGEVYEKVGDIPAAREQYTWFVVEPQKFLDKWTSRQHLPAFDRAEDVTLIGHAIDHFAALTQAYRNNPQLDRSILSFFVKAFDEIDRSYYPARLAAAEYFLSHDQTEDAVEQIKAALAANPNDLDAMNLMGGIAVGSFNFDMTDSIIAAIRKVDANALEADLLEARNLMAQRRPADAEPVVQKALAKQPKNIETLGLLAAVNALQLREEKVNQILKQVEQIDPNNATAYFEVAEQLDAMRQYPRAIEKYKVAVARAPWWTAALNGLGLLYTQSGDEDNARQTLELAHQLDPFNLRTTNYLQLLDKMDKFARKESAHFVVIYDPRSDPVIPEYFSDYLESVQAQVCSAYQYTPTVKTFIEVFPTHEAFSVRTTGSTWLPTVGASTGRVIALVAPRPGKNTLGTFDWARVLRHEYTHTVTLGATDNRIAHWFTEGLAVYQEHSPVPWDWVPMLYSAVSKKQFFPLDQLTWAFVRPKRPIDRQLAYAESFWICTYVEETYGHESILKMLELMRHAERQEDVFPKVTGKSIPEFMSDFQAWSEKQVAKWGYDKDSTAKYNELVKQGEELIKSRQYDEAAKVWQQIAELRPVDALPHQRLAGLYSVLKDRKKQIEQFQILAKVELKDNRFAKRIARLLVEDENWSEAGKYALEAVYINPYDIPAHEILRQVDEKTDNAGGAEREKRVIAELTKLQNDQDSSDSLGK